MTSGSQHAGNLKSGGKYLVTPIRNTYFCALIYDWLNRKPDNPITIIIV